MNASLSRTYVKVLVPQAQYMNLNGCHCIDDHYNDRYLAYAAKSRRGAWREAARFLESRKFPAQEGNHE
jgi:hypothetical protein